MFDLIKSIFKPKMAQAVTTTSSKKPVPRIGIINQSSVVDDASLILAVEAIQIQIDRDFGPIWDLYGKLEFYSKTSIVPGDIWQIFILDSSDVSGALGYHELDQTGLLPIARIFAKDDIDNHLSWSVTLSHEILEALGDPDINLTVFVQDSETTGTLFSYEVCDAVEDDSLAYDINGVKVSDFVTPQWFNTRCQPNSAQFDFCNKVHSPFTLWMGGYIGSMRVGPDSKGWTQIFAETHPSKRVRIHGINSRFHRRKKKAFSPKS